MLRRLVSTHPSKGYLDSLDELSLVFSDGTSDVGADEEGVEAREDSEHLVGVLGGAELQRKERMRVSVK